MTSQEFDNHTPSLTVGFTQPLLRGAWPLVVNEPVVSAKSDLRKEEISLACCDINSRQGLIFQVISKYYGIKNQLELVEIANLAVERSEKLYKATLAKLRVELATQLDVSRAGVQLSSQERALNLARQELGTQVEAFKVLLGLDSQESIELTDEVRYEPSDEIKEEDLAGYIETALKNRPDIRVAKIKVEDSERKRLIARMDLLPDLNSSFIYSVSNVTGFNETDDPSEKSWITGVTLSYPLPLTSRKITIDTSEIALKREKRLLVEQQAEVTRQVKTDLRNAIKGQEQIAIVKTEIEGAEKKLRIANFRFERGLASNFDIVDAENNLIQAKQNRTQSIVNYQIAKAQLKRDMGVLSDEE